MSRGLVCIATGTYDVFVDPLISAVDANGTADILFVLTDNAARLTRSEDRVGRTTVQYLPWGSLPWPYPTLWRYVAISAYADQFRDRVSHLVYCDVDMRPVGDCSALFDDVLVAVEHPGNLNRGNSTMPFVTDISSKAYTSPSQDSVYVAGGVQGGPVALYLEAVESCKSAILDDYRRGVMAQWHDESHWNAYVDRAANVHVLGCEYCWPETWAASDGLPAPRLLALDKDHHHLRGTSPGLRERLRKSKLGESGVALIKRVKS
ncbi:MAG: Abo [Marmoricola sp.]|jgi:hypothetical protein|nr:Abo [Marmoricola sp.]